VCCAERTLRTTGKRPLSTRLLPSPRLQDQSWPMSKRRRPTAGVSPMHGVSARDRRRRPCGRRTDTVCQPCEHGTSYADLTSHDQPCLRCTRCSQFAVVERNCTVMYDATCHRCRKGRLTKPIYAFAAISKLIVARSNTGLRNEIWQIR